MFFISDTHFHHDRIRTLAERPFSSVEEMNEKLVENWNCVVRPNDVVWHLGDFAYGTWKGGDPAVTFSRLNGVKHLVKGNHDHDETLQLEWAGVYSMRTIKWNGKKVVLCHYPMIEWDGCFHGTYHFHGHTHQANPLSVLDTDMHEDRFSRYRKNWRNVSVEMIDYTPKHIDELLKD